MILPRGTGALKAERLTTMTQLHIGQTVTNFGQKATVVGFHEITGDPILENKAIGRWIAVADKCSPDSTAWMHRDGLVSIG